MNIDVIIRVRSTIKHYLLVLLLCSLTPVLVDCRGNHNGDAGLAAPAGLAVVVDPAPSVSLSWNAVPGASAYNIYRSYSSGLSKSTGTRIQTVTGTVSAADTMVTNGAAYYYIVSAVIGPTEGPASAEIAAKLAVPMAPATVMAVAGDQRVAINWSNVPDATTYGVYRSLDGASYTLAASGLTGTAFSDGNLNNGQMYYYVVKASNAFGEGPASPEATAVPTAAPPSGTISISGVVRYEDREYDESVGHTGNTSFKKVRHAEVNLVDTSTSATLTTAATSSTGAYLLTVAASEIGKTVYVRALSSASPAGGQTITVRNLSSARYGVKTSDFVLSADTSVNLSIPVTNQGCSAFNILDVLTSGFEFINNLTGAPPSLGLNAFWQPNNTLGTWFCTEYDAVYCRGGEGIYVLHDPFGDTDTDDFDDDVLWHELGHFMAAKLSKDDSRGGLHYLDSNDLDLRLSWSEGWGNFFPAAVKSWLFANAPELLSASPATPLSQYIDTMTGATYITIDIGSPESSFPYCMPDLCKYASSEIAVANVLWNLMSGTGNFGMAPVWAVFDDYLQTVSTGPVNLEAFWDGWRSGANPDVTGIFEARLINYKEDVFESSDDVYLTARNVTLPVAEVHYLYKNTFGVDDKDVVGFTVTGPDVGRSFIIETTAQDTLKNGADTYLTILNSSGNLTGYSNDNYTNAVYNTNACTISGSCPPNGDIYSFFGNYLSPALLSSRITFTPTASGTYYVEVKTSPNRPSSAGRYGTYTLTITSP